MSLVCMTKLQYDNNNSSSSGQTHRQMQHQQHQQQQQQQHQQQPELQQQPHQQQSDCSSLHGQLLPPSATAVAGGAAGGAAGGVSGGAAVGAAGGAPLWQRLLLAQPIEQFDSGAEHLYGVFNSCARHSDVHCLLTLAISCSCLLLVRETLQLAPRAVAVTLLATLLTVQLVAIGCLKLVPQLPAGRMGGHRRLQQRMLKLLARQLPVVGWLLLSASVVAACVLTHTGLEWFTVTILAVFIWLPLRFAYAALLAAVTIAVYVELAVAMSADASNFSRQLSAGVVVLAGAAVLGAIGSRMDDWRRRTTYLESRKVIQVKAVIEQQSRTRERLLLSVLPRHVAELMRKDWGQMDVGQFKKVYMNRHENVSILFADIVGFTAISSTYSASDLVKVLNELFASFDRLADQYKQLRIKILGDCYYCISGCPVESEDHAVLSVQMGLSMVSAIKSVRESTRSTVDMRVGIHTGAVLAGVMGQKQWQFDVYSKDVELANKMESSGRPGRVHVSNKTLQHLGDYFKVEPANAEKQEPNLRRAGLTTYFIVKPLKPLDSSLSGTEEPTKLDNGESKQSASRVTSSGDNHTTTAIDIETEPANSGRAESHSQTDQIEAEILLSRKRFSDLLPHISLMTLTFSDIDMETDYRSVRESTFGYGSAYLPIALLFITASQMTLTPSSIYSVVCSGVAFLLLTAMAAIMLPLPCLQRCSSCFSSLSDLIRSSSRRTTLWMITMNIVGLTCNVLNMMICPLTKSAPLLGTWSDLNTIQDLNGTHRCSILNGSTVLEQAPSLPPLPPLAPAHCLHVGHFVYMCVLLLCTLPLQVEMSHLVKLPITVVAVVAHCWVARGLHSTLINCAAASDKWHATYDLTASTELCISLAVVGVIVLWFNLFSEVTDRIEFLSRREMAKQKLAATELQQKNESLVQNLLPAHVTQHFLHRDVSMQKHEELYAQSFEYVGVLFAAMPNFSDFYTEESVNNQGLECLRFLNEVISDYDALLNKPKYRGITKIKTIASTYMAASGLEDTRVEPVTDQWLHLALLVEFALDLRNTLNSINTESFNHFVLQMGINHGPVTAGVIGARKPHYDIWGNTVNVASRMETTGQAGHIQCTAETKDILETFGFEFEQRGMINIKGKGQLLTYFLVGRKST